MAWKSITKSNLTTSEALQDNSYSTNVRNLLRETPTQDEEEGFLSRFFGGKIWATQLEEIYAPEEDDWWLTRWIKKAFSTLPVLSEGIAQSLVKTWQFIWEGIANELYQPEAPTRPKFTDYVGDNPEVQKAYEEAWDNYNQFYETQYENRRKIISKWASGVLLWWTSFFPLSALPEMIAFNFALWASWLDKPLWKALQPPVSYLQKSFKKIGIDIDDETAAQATMELITRGWGKAFKGALKVPELTRNIKSKLELERVALENFSLENLRKAANEEIGKVIKEDGITQEPTINDILDVAIREKTWRGWLITIEDFERIANEMGYELSNKLWVSEATLKPSEFELEAYDRHILWETNPTRLDAEASNKVTQVTVVEKVARELEQMSRKERKAELAKYDRNTRNLINEEILNIKSTRAKMKNNRAVKDGSSVNARGDKELVYNEKLAEIATNEVDVKRIDIKDWSELYFYKTPEGNEYHLPKEVVEKWNAENPDLPIKTPTEATPYGEFKVRNKALSTKERAVELLKRELPGVDEWIISQKVDEAITRNSEVNAKRGKLEKAKAKVLDNLLSKWDVDNFSKVIEDVKWEVEWTRSTTKPWKFDFEWVEWKLKEINTPWKLSAEASKLAEAEVKSYIESYLKKNKVTPRYDIIPENFSKALRDIKEGEMYQWAWKKISLPKGLREVLRKYDVAKLKVEFLKDKAKTLIKYSNEFKWDVLDFLRSNKELFSKSDYSYLYNKWGKNKLSFEDYRDFNERVRMFGEDVNKRRFLSERNEIESNMKKVLKSAKSKNPKYLSETVVLVKKIGRIYDMFKTVGDVGILQKLNEALNRVMEEGRAWENEVRLERVNRIKELTDEMKTEIGNANYKTTVVDVVPWEFKFAEGGNPINSGWFKKAWGRVQKFDNYMATIDRTLAKIGWGENSTFYKFFHNMTNAINNRISYISDKWYSRLGSVMDEYFQKNEGVTDEDLGIYLLSQQSWGKEALLEALNWVRDLSQLNKIIAKVENSNWITSIKDFLWSKENGFNTEYSRKVAEKFEEFNPWKKLDLIENYLPFYKTNSEIDLKAMLEGDKTPFSIASWFTRERVGWGRFELNMKASEIITRMIREQVSYVEKKTHAYRMREVAKRLSQWERIDGVEWKAFMSKGSTKILRDYIDFDLSWGRDLEAWISGYKFLNMARGYANKILILYKASTVIKQMTGLLDWKALWAHIGFGMKSLFDWNVRPTEVSIWLRKRLIDVVYMDDSMLNKYYYDSNWNPRKTLNTWAKKLWDVYQELWGYGIKKADGYTAEAVWVWFYKKHLDDNGLTYKWEITANSYNPYAAEYADIMTKRVMGAMDTTTAPPILRALHGKSIFAMGMVQLYRWNMLRQDLLPDLVKSMKTGKGVGKSLANLGWFLAANVAEQTAQNLYTIGKTLVVKGCPDATEDEIYRNAIKQFGWLKGFFEQSAIAALTNYVPGISTVISWVTYGWSWVAPIDVYQKILKQGIRGYDKMREGMSVGDYNKALYGLLWMISNIIPSWDLNLIWKRMENKYKKSPKASYFNDLLKYKESYDKQFEWR